MFFPIFRKRAYAGILFGAESKIGLTNHENVLKGRPIMTRRHSECAMFILSIAVSYTIAQDNYYKLSKFYRGVTAIGGGLDHRAFKYPSEAGVYQNQGVAWYTLAEDKGSLTGNPRYELYKIQNGSYYDFMTSSTQNEGGYVLENNLGRMFSSQALSVNGASITPSPLQSVNRYYRAWTTGSWPWQSSWRDHLTGFPGEAPSGYSSEGSLGYAFPRYNWDMQDGTSGPAVDQSISANGVDVGFIKSWGGSLSTISYNGVQYINRAEPGRLLQPAANLELYSERYNPTEGGDHFKNGAPVMYYEKLSANRFATRTMPVMFKNPTGTFANLYIDGLDPRHPLLYGGSIFKDVEILGNVGNARVIRYDAGFVPCEGVARTWGMIHLAYHFNYDGLMNPLNTPAGYHRFYQQSGGVYSQVGSAVNINIPTGGNLWEQPWGTSPSGANVLIISEGNGNNRAIGVLYQNPTSPSTYTKSVTSYRGHDGSGPGDQYALNSQGFYLEFRNVALNHNQQFWVRTFIMLGTKDEILAAANSFPY